MFYNGVKWIIIQDIRKHSFYILFSLHTQNVKEKPLEHALLHFTFLIENVGCSKEKRITQTFNCMLILKAIDKNAKQ